MKSMRIRSEYQLFIVSALCLAILAFSHLILMDKFLEHAWVEYTAAFIPVAIVAIGLLSIRFSVTRERQ